MRCGSQVSLSKYQSSSEQEVLRVPVSDAIGGELSDAFAILFIDSDSVEASLRLSDGFGLLEDGGELADVFSIGIDGGEASFRFLDGFELLEVGLFGIEIS